MAPPKTAEDFDQATRAAEQAMAETEPSAPEPFDWGALDAPVAMPSKSVTVSRTVDVLAEIPEPIRQRIEISLGKTMVKIAAKANSTARRVRIDPHWEVQPVPTDAIGADFIKLATRYAKYRPADKDVPWADDNAPKGQITVRCGAVTRYRQTEHGPVPSPDASPAESFLGVRYSARPFEGRQDSARMPGTTTP